MGVGVASSKFCSGRAWLGKEVVALLLARLIPKIITPPKIMPSIMAKIISLRISFY